MRHAAATQGLGISVILGFPPYLRAGMHTQEDGVILEWPTATRAQIVM